MHLHRLSTTPTRPTAAGSFTNQTKETRTDVPRYVPPKDTRAPMGKYKWGDGSGPSARDRQTERESWKEERAAELDAAIRSLPEPYHWGSENFLEGNTRKSHSFFRDLQTVQQVKDYQLGTLAAFPGGDVDEAQQRLDQTATRSGLLAEQRALSAAGAGGTFVPTGFPAYL